MCQPQTNAIGVLSYVYKISFSLKLKRLLKSRKTLFLFESPKTVWTVFVGSGPEKKSVKHSKTALLSDFNPKAVKNAVYSVAIRAALSHNCRGNPFDRN